MIDPTKTTPEKLAEMNDSLIVDNNHLREQLKLVRDDNTDLHGRLDALLRKGTCPLCGAKR
jgi:hypothetical protein